MSKIEKNISADDYSNLSLREIIEELTIVDPNSDNWQLLIDQIHQRDKNLMREVVKILDSVPDGEKSKYLAILSPKKVTHHEFLTPMEISFFIFLISVIFLISMSK